MDGILLVNKVEECTSTEIVRRAKKALRVKKVGHGGTLDPFAKGLLILLLGKGTRLFDKIMELDKTYKATVFLGVETDTYDREGKVVRKNDGLKPTQEEIETRLGIFSGTIYQSPPRYSAVKVHGKRAYELARRGKDFELKPREVLVHRVLLEDYQYPFLRITVKAGKGFYMRSLAHDLGIQLGTGAHLYELCRVAIGPFKVEDGIQSKEMISGTNELPKRVLSLERAIEMIDRYKNMKEDEIGLYK